jgi:hypothetical protein
LATFTELSWKSCSFFVVTHQAEHKNDKDSQQKGWQVPELANKTPFLAQFLCKTSKFGPNVAKFEAFTDSSWLPCSFFVVSYQAEQKNGQGHQAVHW